MKKIDLGQTITILANIGVIAGIIILALELQQNNDLLAAQARSDLTDRATRFGELLMASPDLAEIIIKRAADEPLSTGEEFRFAEVGRRLLISFESQFIEVESGVVSEDTLPVRQWSAMFHVASGSDYGLKDHWEKVYRFQARRSFVAFMEEQIIEPGPP